MADTARLLELADFIESAQFKFDMGLCDVSPSCGTAGCIGGHAAVLWPETRDYEHSDPQSEFTFDDCMLQVKMGIAHETFSALCYPEIAWNTITREEAVAVLRRLAETGEVVWRAAGQSKEKPQRHKESAQT